MEFFLEMFLTVVVALLLSFSFAKLVSAVTSGNGGCVGGNDLASDQSRKLEIGGGEGSVAEEICFGLKLDAGVIQSERNFRIVDENVELVDRFENEVDRVAKGERSVDLTSEAESAADVSPRNVTEELRFGVKIDDAPVVQSERNFPTVDENVDHVDRLKNEADRVDQAAKGEQSVDLTSEAESMAAASPENVTEGLHFGVKIGVPVLKSERNIELVDENVVSVDRSENEADQEATKGEESVVLASEAESTAAVSPENVITEDERRESVEEINGEIGTERDESVVQITEAESTAAVLPENVIAEEMILDERRYLTGEIDSEREELMVRTIEAESNPSVLLTEERINQGQEELSESTERRRDSLEDKESRDVLLGKSEEVSVEQSTNTVDDSENKMERNAEEENEEKHEEVSVEQSTNAVDDSGNKMQRNAEEENEEKEELIIKDDDDDDWEGIERSELENAFAAASKILEESGKAEEISAEAKMELYGLHKIATEGSCREAQPMAVMVAARAKWNAWQKLGNMSQEEAMEKYLALISKEIPGFMASGYNVGKMPEMETSAVLPPNAVSTEDDVDESSKNGISELS